LEHTGETHVESGWDVWWTLVCRVVGGWSRCWAWWFGGLVVFNDDVQSGEGFFFLVSKVSVRRFEEIWEMLIWSD
jgi:hypothetical protein